MKTAATYKTAILLIIVCLFSSEDLFSQAELTDSSKSLAVDTKTVLLKKNEQAYQVNKGRTFIYTKPRNFSFITNLPRDAAGIVRSTFKRESIKPLLLLGGATAVLMLADQPVSNGVRQFSKNIYFHNEQENKNVLSIKLGKTDVSLFKAPQNLNTGIYQMGQGFPSLLLGVGLFTYGKIRHDYRAISTASQLAETFILMGVGTQLLKRIAGRQSPSNATGKGGDWHFLPSFKDYQNNTPNYDAFPSGHLATLMSTVTILAENYPEKRYIKPVGYSLISLVGLSMINNNVHWISDYPLAIALGYLCARQVVKRNRRVIETLSSKKTKREFSYTFNYSCGKLMPGVVYKF